MSKAITLKLTGLHCANCANKIEVACAKINGVLEGNVHFVNQEIRITYAEDITGPDALVANMQKTADQIEPGITVILAEKKRGRAVMPQQAHCHSHTCGHGHIQIQAHDSDESQSHGDNCIHDHEYEHSHLQEPLNQTAVSLSAFFGLGNANRKELICIGTGAALFTIGILTEHYVANEGVSLAVFLAAFACLGWRVVWQALKSIRRGDVFNEYFLMSIAAIGAFCIQDYAEAVAVMLFYDIGEFLQEMAVGRSRRSIQKLMDLAPDYANVIRDDRPVQVPPEDVAIGECILVKPGEKIPLDGKVIEGGSQLDTSSLTGESMPRDVQAGDGVLSGSINLNGALTIEVTSDYSQSTVVKIMDMVENASAKKAPAEKFITKFSRYYTPFVVLSALLLAVAPPLFLPGAAWSNWIYRALVFLVISCPCALIISVPLTFFSGIGAASRRGILIKGGNYMQALGEVNMIVFDKTGTLTHGVFEVTEISPAEGFSRVQLLQAAYSLESLSNHPIAKSITAAYEKESVGLPLPLPLTDYEELSGFGLKAKNGAKAIAAGNGRMMARENIAYTTYQAQGQDQDQDMGTVIYMAMDGRWMGSIVIADKIKEGAKSALSALRKQGIQQAVMLTGDRQNTGEAIARIIGIDRVYAELLPNEKVEKLEALYQENVGNKIIFVGDGINDAPVLARADIGIAMGGAGSAAAIEAADVVLMTDEPARITDAITIARKTSRIAAQNITFALTVKAVVLALGAMGIASMWLAVFADVGVTLLVILNAMRKK